MEAKHKEELSLWETFQVLFSASRAFWLVNLVNFGDGIAYFGMLTLMTRFLGQDVGMSDQQVGISVSAYTGLVTLFMLGGGAVSDRLGVRRALAWSLGVMGIGRLMLTLAPGLDGDAKIVAWTGLLFMAAGSGVIQPALYAGVKEFTDSRTATLGYGLLYSIMNLGIVAENFVSPYIREDGVFLNLGFTEIIGLGWGVGGVFWMCTALTGFLLFLHMTLFTRKVEAIAIDSVQQADAPEEPPVDGPGGIFPLLDPRFLYFIFILLPVRTLFAHQFLTMPDYVFRCFPAHVSDKFEWINGLNPLIIVLFVPLIAALTRKARVVDMMIIGTSISALTTFLLVPGPNVTLLLAYVILFSLGEAVWGSRFLEHVANLAPVGKVGAYMGFACIPWFLAKFTTGLYSGAMLARYIPEGGPADPSTLWFIYGCIACISPIGLLLARKWLITDRG